MLYTRVARARARTTTHGQETEAAVARTRHEGTSEEARPVGSTGWTETGSSARAPSELSGAPSHQGPTSRTLTHVVDDGTRAHSSHRTLPGHAVRGGTTTARDFGEEMCERPSALTLLLPNGARLPCNPVLFSPLSLGRSLPRSLSLSRFPHVAPIRMYDQFGFTCAPSTVAFVLSFSLRFLSHVYRP